MKYLKKYKIFESMDEQKIHDLCKKYGIENYTINNEGSIDVNGSVYLEVKGLTKLPIRFRNVSESFMYGHFYCYNNNLTSLEGAPNRVGGDFVCNNNQLTSLEGAPTSVGGDFYCFNNKLTSLEGGGFYCSNNQLTSLEGAPSQVGGGFYCHNNNLTSLKGVPNSVNDFWCQNNKLTNLEGLEWKSFDNIDLRNNPVYEVVKDWINNKDRIELIEYFIDMNVIQQSEDKPKLILPRLEAFHEEMELEMNIDFEEVKKYYEIIK